jgi:3-methyladenine DNA glycosylase AlkD
MLTEIKKELRKYASKERKQSNERFFKTGQGEYGEGDIFIGVRVPNIRKVVKKFSEVDLRILKQLLYSKIHEERLLALLILVNQNKQALKQKNKQIQKRIATFYLKHKRQINNWDLVDLSAHYILGQAIWDELYPEKVLDKMVVSFNLWERRIGIVSTFVMIRNGKINTTLRLAEKLLNDKEDLIHKAVGWMLREAWKLGEERKNKTLAESEKGKKSQEQVELFLIKNYNQLPRTTLRYAIERMTEVKRKKFLLKGELF